MGLDWVVLAKERNGIEVNPTEVIGARRASRDDPDVVEELGRIWQGGDQSQSFDDFVEALVTRETPPIVIQFGKEHGAAMPAVRAEVQYYGFRAKAIEPKHNRVSAFAEAQGHDYAWLYGDLENRGDIEKRAGELEQALDRYKGENSEICAFAERYYRAWRQGSLQDMTPLEEQMSANADLEDHVYELFSLLGAIDWLRFWSDKGFKIAADF